MARLKEVGSLRGMGMTTVAIDAQTKARLKALADADGKQLRIKVRELVDLAENIEASESGTNGLKRPLPGSGYTSVPVMASKLDRVEAKLDTVLRGLLHMEDDPTPEEIDKLPITDFTSLARAFSTGHRSLDVIVAEYMKYRQEHKVETVTQANLKLATD